jgi:hypothetical protein
MSAFDRSQSQQSDSRSLLLPLATGLILCLIFSLSVPAPASAWFGDGHRLIARLAAASAPAELPDFFRGGSSAIADASVEPDMLRRRELPQLRSSEYPEHYVDLEFLEGAEFPATRYEYLELLYEKKLQPNRVGMVPYAIVEATQQLAVSLAEYRLRPDDAGLQARILYRAGVLSHYAADMSQPLHTTLHHDGRALADGSSPGTGIHRLVDSLPGRAGATFSPSDCTPWPEPFSDLMHAVLDALQVSHALVDRVYELEGSLQWDDENGPDGEVVALANERLTSAVLFTSRLFATAWDLSTRVELPESLVARTQKQAE